MNKSGRRWQRRSYHHGNLKEVLLEAARKLIEEHGAFGFSLTEAARLAGVSPAAPYRHFRDRDALLAEVARTGFERFAARLDAAWNNGIPTPLSAFEALGRAYLAFAREDPASYAVMFESGATAENRGEAIQAAASSPAAEKAFNVLQQAAAAICQHLPENERPPLKLVAMHFWTMSHGIASLFIQEGSAARKIPLTPEEVLESGLLIYLKGLGVLPEGAAQETPEQNSQDSSEGAS